MSIDSFSRTSGINLTVVQPQDFPESPFSHMLVNKEFFVQAAECYVRNHTFLFSSIYDLRSVLKAEGAAKKGFLHCIASLKLSTMNCHSTLSTLPGLRDVECIFSPQFLSSADHRNPWHSEFSELDFVGISGIRELLKLRGLKHIRVTPSSTPPTKCTSEQDIWERNVRRLNDLLCEVTTRPRVMSADEPQDSRAWIHPQTGVITLRAPQNSENWIHLQTAVRPKKASEHEADKDMRGSKEFSVDDIPSTERDFIRMLCERPREFFDWTQKAKNQMREHGASME